MQLVHSWTTRCRSEVHRGDWRFPCEIRRASCRWTGDALTRSPPRLSSSDDLTASRNRCTRLSGAHGNCTKSHAPPRIMDTRTSISTFVPAINTGVSGANSTSVHESVGNFVFRADNSDIRPGIRKDILRSRAWASHDIETSISDDLPKSGSFIAGIRDNQNRETSIPPATFLILSVFSTTHCKASLSPYPPVAIGPIRADVQATPSEECSCIPSVQLPSGTRWSDMQTTAPVPPVRRFRTVIDPPCASTRRRAVDSPSPLRLPEGCSEKKGSSACSRAVSENPGP